MKNSISTIIILLSLSLLIYTAMLGLQIGDFQIFSVSQLVEKNNDITDKINYAAELAVESYSDNKETLEGTFEKYKTQKQAYEKLVGSSSSVDKEIYETKQYDISYLWRVIGKYATNRNLELGIDVQKSNTSKTAYNFNFSVTGDYVKILEFIMDIENDSDLYFRIYNFKLEVSPKDEENKKTLLNGTFVVRNINIDSSTIK